MREALEIADKKRPLDLVIANAGVIPDTAGEVYRVLLYYIRVLYN